MDEQYQSEENKYVSPATQVECHNPGATMWSRGTAAYSQNGVHGL